MVTVVKSAWTVFVGWVSVILAQRNGSAAVVRALFAKAPNAAAEKSTIRRTLFLTKKALVTLLSSGDMEYPEKQPDVLVLGPIPGPGVKEARERYLRDFGERGSLWMFSESTCPNCLGWPGRLAGAGLLGLLAIVNAPAPLLLRNNSAFERIAEIARAIRCVEFIRRCRPQRVYFFGSFDRNANLIAKLVSGTGVWILRFCSPNPLGFHYRHCVADEFVLSSPLQIPEYREFQSSWFVNSVRLWRPPNYASFPEVSYRQGDGKGRSIGFLSGGQWRRHERGDLFDEDRMKNLRGEEELHQALCEYLEMRPDVELTVYPHPSEKVNENVFRRARELYVERLGKDRVKLLKPNERTQDHYGDADVLVALWSSSATEALYCGNKVLFSRLVGDATVTESSLLRVHVFDRETLWQRLDQCLAMTVQEYFEAFELLSYRYDHYDRGPVPVSMKAAEEDTKI